MNAYDYLVNAYSYDFSNLNILECGSSQTGSETESFRTNNNCYYIEANPTDYSNMLNQPNVNKTNIIIKFIICCINLFSSMYVCNLFDTNLFDGFIDNK